MFSALPILRPCSVENMGTEHAKSLMLQVTGFSGMDKTIPEWAPKENRTTAV
jgi:hypothetical protein